MFGRYTAKRVVFEPYKDLSQKFYYKDLADAPPLRSIPMAINTSAHITCFERMNNEQKLIPGPGHYELYRITYFTRPYSSLHMPITVINAPSTDTRDFTFDIKQFRKIAYSTVCHSFNTSDRWKSGLTYIEKFVEEQRRAKSQTAKRKRSKFCE